MKPATTDARSGGHEYSAPRFLSVQPNHPLCSEATPAVSKLIRQKDAVLFLRANQAAEGKVHDARLVAITNVYAGQSVLTFNSDDFERFSSIRAIHPSSSPP